MERGLHWDRCWNVRDIGGYATRSGQTTRFRRVVRAGNLSRLTEPGRDALLAYGVKTVIDLRDPREHAIELDPFHERGAWAGQVEYLSVPLISEAEWTAIRDPILRKRGYELTLDLSREHVARVISAVASAPDVVVLHCHAGKERTGVVSALLLELVGVADQLIGEDYVESDRHLAGLYDEWAQREEDPEKRTRLRESFQSEAAHILGPLEYVRAQGGIESFLVQAGVRGELLSGLKSRLLG